MVTIRRLTLGIAQTAIALIFLQTLYFKFTGAPESVFIFSTIGMEPWGRYLVGVIELFAAILVVMPRTSLYGAFLSLVIVVPALIFHFTTLGIVVNNDSGLLFGLALTILVLSVFVIALRWPRKGLP